jgi:hypothetical protein
LNSLKKKPALFFCDESISITAWACIIPSTCNNETRRRSLHTLDGEVFLLLFPIGGTNVAKVLNEHFGSVKTIKGYLVVRESTPLISLDFFKNLTTIQVRRGYGFSAKE